MSLNGSDTAVPLMQEAVLLPQPISAPVLPGLHLCYSEGLFVGSALLHGLTPQDAHAHGLISTWSQDWARKVTVQGNFSSAACAWTLAYGVPRLTDLDGKLVPLGETALHIRASAYRLKRLSAPKLAARLEMPLQSCSDVTIVLS